MKKILYLISKLTDLDVEWLAKCGERVTLKQKDILIEQDKAADSIYIILDGEVLVSHKYPAEKKLAVLRSGEIVGEMSFVEDALPSATVSALGEVSALRVSKALLLDKLQQDCSFAARFYKAIAATLSDRLRTAMAYDEKSISQSSSCDKNLSDGDERLTRILNMLRGAK
ncbi:cyclic nucleotide-binding protein [Candidatus Magnetoovum chiemensis]|nr:cyclic nucleotide-binding protein [Candidatus Magnetoovum chiemensis]